MTGENREQGKLGENLGKRKKNEWFLIVISNNTYLKKLTYRRVKYVVNPKTGYSNCNSIMYASQFCSALDFLGEKNSEKVQLWAIINFQNVALAVKWHYTFF